MEENILYNQNTAGGNSGGSVFFDPLPASDFSDFSFTERGEDSWALGAPGKPGDVGGKFPQGETGVALSDALPFMLLLVVAYVFVMKKIGKLKKQEPM